MPGNHDIQDFLNISPFPPGVEFRDAVGSPLPQRCSSGNVLSTSVLQIRSNSSGPVRHFPEISFA